MSLESTDRWLCLIVRSFGVLLWEVFSLGYAPYTGRGNEQVMDLVASGERLEQPPGCPFPVYVIMTSCWNSCPASRPVFAQIIAQLRHCQQVARVAYTRWPKTDGTLIDCSHL